MVTYKAWAVLILTVGCMVYGENRLICPAKIKSFSIGARNEFYYNCTKEGDVPSLERCPDNEVYWPVQEKCFTAGVDGDNSEGYAQKSDLHTFIQPVLGRPVYLGCLFDARKSEIMPGDSFWKRKTVEENKVSSASFGSHLYFFAAQSTFGRFSHMDFDASLKLDFLGGLISVEGSASYLNDKVESQNTVAVVMKSHYITRSETLPTATVKDYNDLCNLKGPTHVVTSIIYGMDAHFVFKKTAKTDESREKIAGSLKVAVRSLPSIKIEGEAKANISGSLKEIIKNIEVKLYGDFVLDKQPTTYEESIFVYKTLTSHLGKLPEYANAAKMKMQLTPITRFCDKQTAILVSISNMLLDSVTTMLDEIERMSLRAKTLAMSDSVNRYLPLRTIMSTFINKLRIFQLGITSELQTLLPDIRGGGASGGEKGLIELLTKYRHSAFNYESSVNFLKVRKREIQMIDYILDPATFTGTDVKLLNFEEATDDKILFKKPLVVMIKFNILPSVHIVNQFIEGKKVDESTSWFNVPEVVATMGKVFKAFMEFASVNKNSKGRGYLVSMYNANKIFVNIFIQKDGTILSSNFKFPERPSTLTTISYTHNSIIFGVEKPSNKWVEGFEIKYWKYARGESAIEKRFTFTKETITNVEVTGLLPNEVYQFSIKYVTAMGCSPPATEITTVVTRPCSPPANVRVKDLTSTSFRIQWDPPMHYGSGIQIVNYLVKIKENNAIIRKVVVAECYVLIEGLNAATTFDITIQANAKRLTYNDTQPTKEVTAVSLPSWLRVITTPDSPLAPHLVSISYHSAEVRWNPPTRIAVGATIQDYLMKYSKMNNLGSETVIGSNMVQSSSNKTSASLNNLIQGTTYGISVRISTTLGSSIYSPVLIIRTRYRQTDLDALRILLEDKINTNKHYLLDLRESVSRDVSHIESQIKETIHYQYTRYRARFMGVGYSCCSDHEIPKGGVTLDECISWCYNERKSDDRYDGLNYCISAKECYCQRAHKRGTIAHNNWLHYQFY